MQYLPALWSTPGHTVHMAVSVLRKTSAHIKITPLYVELFGFTVTNREKQKLQPEHLGWDHYVLQSGGGACRESDDMSTS